RNSTSTFTPPSRTARRHSICLREKPLHLNFRCSSNVVPRRHEDTKTRRHEDTKTRRHEDTNDGLLDSTTLWTPGLSRLCWTLKHHASPPTRPPLCAGHDDRRGGTGTRTG